MTGGPLDGMRVIDASIMAAGPWTGSLLGMLGAEVIKVEPPAGDGTRWVEPLQHGMGTNYMCLNVNKKGIELDLKSAQGKAAALDLIASADVFIQNFRGGVIDRLGLGYPVAAERNPRLVYCSITGFGEVGPLAREACADFIMQAYSGFARLNGSAKDGVEAFRFSGFIDLATSIVAVESIAAALVRRGQTGRGQKIEVSMLQAALEIQATRIAEYLGSGRVPAAMGSESPGLAPDRAFRALDGEVFVTVHDEPQWRGFCAAIGLPELGDDPRFTTVAARVSGRDALSALIEPVIAGRPVIWWMRAFERHGVPCAFEHNFETFRHHAQIVENGMVATHETPRWGTVCVGGAPWRFSRTPAKVLPAPMPGADTQAVLAQARTPSHAPATGAGEDHPDGLPLRGVRVVELASGVAGPLAGARLADLGADVVKVETGGGDWLRACPPTLDGEATGAAFFALNRGKRALGLTADDEEARVTLRALVERADILVTDWDEERLASWGLAEAAAETCGFNPGLITILVSCFGRRGPLRRKPGSELCAQAMAGYTRYVGERSGPKVRLGADVAGTATGIFATQAALVCLLERGRSGLGQTVDVSLLNSLLSMKTVQLAAQSDPDTFQGPRVGGATYPPERGWRTADDPITFAFGGAVGAEGKPGWEQFVEEVGLERLLDDPRFDRSGRNTTGLGFAASEMKPEYETAFVNFPAEELVERVRRLGGYASAYMRHENLMAEPQVAALGIVGRVRQGKASVAALAFPARFTDLAPALAGEAPACGQHNQSILAELGLRTPAARKVG